MPRRAGVAASLQSDSMGSVRKSKRGVRKSRAKAQTESTPDGAPSTALQHRATQAARRAMNLATSGFPSFEQLQARTGKFFARVEKKLEQVPDERRQPPPATIAAPAALQYALLGEAPEAAELREMFENLLASSMDSDTASSAHPAFVSMISQMSRDEARILKHPDAYYGEDLGLTTERFEQCMSNLERLGIVKTIQIDTYTGRHPTTDTTPLGRAFLGTCVRPQAS